MELKPTDQLIKEQLIQLGLQIKARHQSPFQAVTYSRMLQADALALLVAQAEYLERNFTLHVKTTLRAAFEDKGDQKTVLIDLDNRVKGIQAVRKEFERVSKQVGETRVMQPDGTVLVKSCGLSPDYEHLTSLLTEAYLTLINNPFYVQATEIVKERHATLDAQEQASSTSLEVYASYTYLLTNTGSVSVLVDEQARALAHNEAAPDRLFTLLQPIAARTRASNIPFYEERGGKLVEGNVYDAWVKSKSRKDLNGVTFDPHTTERIVNNKFNVWRGFRDWGPAKPGADKVFWDELVFKRICNSNKDYFEFVQKWLAHMVQKPWERPYCTIGISCKQGYGKSLFVKAIGMLLHPSHYNPNVKMEHLTGETMSRILEGLLLGYLDEATWGGNKSKTGEIKKAITGDTDYINEKFVQAYDIPTYKRLIFTSNDSYYYHADADDRRLLPLEIDESWGKFPLELAQHIMNHQDPIPEFQATLFETLMNVDIEGWVPHIALNNLNIVTGRAMLEKSMTPVQSWMYMSLNNKEFNLGKDADGAYLTIFQGAVTPHDLQASFNDYCLSDSNAARNRVNLSSSFEAMDVIYKTFGGKAKNRRIGGKPTRSYMIDWDQMRENFAAQFKWKLEWEDIEEAQSTKLDGLTLAFASSK